ncbi:hypothetical protein [Marichromatium sp. AB31]|uniref:hypothetical protein n=1 Tax=Marichromatium sp. AB31 TaxID=2483362 RepID=UPI000F3F1CCE|nr:hypothetical protein [Marichromatium sp. AB31]RNE88475.1 hypothetical protein EBL84_16170 [Marichromatium sp. AB31]
MRPILLTPLLFALALPAPSLAQEAETDAWERAQTTAAAWWQRSRELADQAAADARRLLGDDDDDLGRAWERARPELEEALTLTERQATLPERAWFGPDRDSNQTEIDALLDRAVALLSVSPALAQRARIRELNARIVELRAQIAESRQQQLTAPEQSTLLKTRADHAEAIARDQREITAIEAEIAAIERGFAAELRAMGLHIDDEQVRFLLSTVVGDNVVELGILFDNVRTLTEQLEQLVAESGEDLESARRYYGLYVVLLQTLEHLHRRIERQIEDDYLPRIDAIAERARTLAAETRTLKAQNPERTALLEANLEAQRVTGEAAAVYRSYLEDQARQIRAARAQLAGDIATAWNTYQTVSLSGELVGLVRASQRLLEALMERQLPALRPFENLEMQREMLRLTERLRGPDQGR